MEKNVNNASVNNVVKGEVFIIPNKSVSRLEFENDYGKKWFNSILSDWKYDDTYEFNTKLIQIWATGDGCDNWHDHGKELNGKRFPRYIPFSWVKDLKEGDVLKIEYNGVKIELTAAQLKYRYRSFGKFEDVLMYVL